MHDLSGFALLLVAFALLLWVLMQFVLPFLATYLMGIVLFLIATSILLRRGRLHPIHFDSLLRPGVGPAIAVLAVALPLIHAGAYFVSSGKSWWVYVLALNVVPTTLWTGNLLRVHHRQKARYFSEGHDIEDLLREVVSRDNALEVRSDALESAAASSRPPQAWELAAGDGLNPLMDQAPALRQLIVDLAGLRALYAPVRDRLTKDYEDARTWGCASKPELDRVREMLGSLGEQWDALMATSETALAGTLPGRLAGWDDEG